MVQFSEGTLLAFHFTIRQICKRRFMKAELRMPLKGIYNSHSYFALRVAPVGFGQSRLRASWADEGRAKSKVLSLVGALTPGWSSGMQPGGRCCYSKNQRERNMQ